MCAAAGNPAGHSVRRSPRIRKAILDTLQQNLRDGGVGTPIPVDSLRDAPFVEGVLYRPAGAWIIDTEQVAENEILVRSEQVHRGRTGTEVRHLVLLCPQRAASPGWQATVPEERLAALQSSERALDAR